MNPNPAPPLAAEPSNTKPTLLLAFSVFAAGYFLSYAMRAVNAALSPDLRAELALSPEALGWLTAAYLVAFAAMQLPLGVALDRYGARRVESILLCIAALGCVVFATGHSFTALFIGRALIGVGVSACLLAAFTSFRQWYAPELMSRLAAWMLVVGTAGALAASVPVRLLADASSWRVVFVVAAVAFILVAVAMWCLFPKAPPVSASANTDASSTSASDSSYRAIFSRQAIIATAPLAFFNQGGFIALQTLWVAPWLMQVLGQTPAQAAQTLFILNASLLVTYIFMGSFAGRLSLPQERRLMLTSFVVCALTLLAITVWQSPLSWVLWPVLAITSTATMMMQARVSVSLPKAIAGRGNVALNLTIFIGGFALQGGIGWAAQALSRVLELPPTQGLALTFAALALAQLASVVWLWAHWRSPINFDSQP